MMDHQYQSVLIAILCYTFLPQTQSAVDFYGKFFHIMSTKVGIRWQDNGLCVLIRISTDLCMLVASIYKHTHKYIYIYIYI